MQGFQFKGPCRANDIRPCREELPKLDVGRSQCREGSRDAIGLRRVCLSALADLRQFQCGAGGPWQFVTLLGGQQRVVARQHKPGLHQPKHIGDGIAHQMRQPE